MGLGSLLGGPLFDLIGKVIDRAIPDPTEKAKLHLELAKLADAENARASNERIAQTRVNQAEAGHSSIFVAGWRPAVGWSCVAGFTYTIIVAPMAGLPVAETALLRDILLGMLGISVAARSVEKLKGVAQNTLTGASPKATPEPTAVSKPKKKILGIAPWPF